jgi:glycosyltransferase involved in cell wall biosynthesis
MPLLSIIIPCYNSGQFLPEAVESVSAYPDRSVYEIIIVDDGSTDQNTLDFLAQLPRKEYTVIHQENKGPAAARNTGIRAAKSDYILFLDSDNKIRSAYIDRGIELLNNRPDVGVVHGNAAFFGAKNKVQFVPSEFSLLKILHSNYIDMCSVVRKSVWEAVGGLDENRSIIGHEDWEFWIRIGESGWKFAHIDEVLFDYRIREDSLTTQVGAEDKISKMLSYVYGKHWKLFMRYFKYLDKQLEYYKEDQNSPVRSFFKYLYNKYIVRRDSETNEFI